MDTFDDYYSKENLFIKAERERERKGKRERGEKEGV